MRPSRDRPPLSSIKARGMQSMYQLPPGPIFFRTAANYRIPPSSETAARTASGYRSSSSVYVNNLICYEKNYVPAGAGRIAVVGAGHVSARWGIIVRWLTGCIGTPGIGPGGSDPRKDQKCGDCL
jgi:hypothetical protein